MNLHIDPETNQVIDDGPRIDRVTATQSVPVVVEPVVQPVHTVIPVAAPIAPVQTTSYTERFAPDAIVAGVVGLILTVIGLIAITRGGFHGPMSLPVVRVLGFTHTTTLGLLEIVFGLCLLLVGISSSRSGALFFGTVLGIASFVGAVQTASFRRNLALESGFAWLVFCGALVVVLFALLMPRFLTRRTVVQRVDQRF